MIDFLHVAIGRGHPFYLDGIIASLQPDEIGSVEDVFDVSRGLPLQAWKGIRTVYRLAAGSALAGALYSQLRAGTDLNRASFTLQLLGRDLRRRYLARPAPLVVAHPLLAAALRGKPDLVYQHGELVAPREALVRGPHRVLVPLASTADAFVRAGLPASQLFVSGLCVEPALVRLAEAAFGARIARWAGDGPLTGAFFSSGAEPLPHVRKLAAAAVSAVQSGGNALLVGRRGGCFAAHATRSFGRRGIAPFVAEPGAAIPRPVPQVLLCGYENRRQLDEVTAALFGRFDYFAAPAHERTNWAAGLGLPMFVVGPDIGSFAPLNRSVLLAQAVAEPLDTRAAADALGGRIAALRREGRLEAMARAGYGRHDIRGFANCAGFLRSAFRG
jgi:hypothetical protein